MIDRNVSAELVKSADANTTGTKLSLTPRSGGTRKVVGVALDVTSGTPTVQLQLVRGADVIVLREDTARFIEGNLAIWLLDTDTLRFEVTNAGGAGSTIDAAIWAQ